MLIEQTKNSRGHTLNTSDLFLIWKEADRLSLRQVVLVDYTIEHKNKGIDIRLILVKSCYLIILHIKINQKHNCNMEVSSCVSFSIGPSNIVSVEFFGEKDQEKRYIVACREGPLHILTLPSNPSNASSANVVGVELFAKNGDCGIPDTKNYRCHGLTKSKNDSIWVFLQNGFLDEQAKFSKGKITFLTQNTFTSLSKLIFDDLGNSWIHGIRGIKDILELYRLLACIDSKNKKTEGNSFDRIFQDLIRKDLTECIQGSALRTEKMQIYLWMCHLFGTLGNNDEMIRSWDCLADDLHRNILCLHALQILRMYFANDPSFNSDIYDENSLASLRTFYLNFWTGDKVEVNKMKLSKYRWKCRLCLKSAKSKNSDDSYTDSYLCLENNHRWPRCVLTLKPCDEPSLLRCRWCESAALRITGLDYTNVYCSICNGPFI